MPYKEAYLEINTEVSIGPLDANQTAEVTHTVVTVQMAKSPTLRGDPSKWAVPRDQLDDAAKAAVRAVEFFVHNVVQPPRDRHTVNVSLVRNFHL